MARKIGVSRNEMLQLREQGLSNRDIANSLEISIPTVLRYIGKQGRRMENLAAFNDPKNKKVEKPSEEPKSVPGAVDTISMVYEAVKSADGSFRAEIDYESNSISILDETIGFEQLAELSTFIIGLASRIEQNKI